MARIRGISEELNFDPASNESIGWTSYSPTTAIRSGSGTLTLDNLQWASYIKFGNFVWAQGETRLTLTGPSTNTVLELDLPVAVNWTSIGDGSFVVGSGIHVWATLSYIPLRCNIVNGDQTMGLYPSNYGEDVFTTASNRWYRWDIRYRIA